MTPPLCRLLVWAALVPLAAPSQAASPKKPVPLADLSIKAQKHGVDCPLPKAGPCIVRKPVGPNYRVLTPGASLEDMGGYWLADFTKIKDAKTNRLVLRVMEESGPPHEIEVRFPPDPAAKEKPVVKEAAKPVEKPKEEVKEQ